MAIGQSARPLRQFSCNVRPNQAYLLASGGGRRVWQLAEPSLSAAKALWITRLPRLTLRCVNATGYGGVSDRATAPPTAARLARHVNTSRGNRWTAAQRRSEGRRPADGGRSDGRAPLCLCDTRPARPGAALATGRHLSAVLRPPAHTAGVD